MRRTGRTTKQYVKALADILETGAAIFYDHEDAPTDMRFKNKHYVKIEGLLEKLLGNSFNHTLLEYKPNPNEKFFIISYKDNHS